jgi:hypothetical protein
MGLLGTYSWEQAAPPGNDGLLRNLQVFYLGSFLHRKLSLAKSHFRSIFINAIPHGAISCPIIPMEVVEVVKEVAEEKL